MPRLRQRSYDPLRSRAIRVVDGRVRAFCSNACLRSRRAAAARAGPFSKKRSRSRPRRAADRGRWPPASALGVVGCSLAVGAPQVVAPAALAPAVHASEAMESPRAPAPQASMDEAKAMMGKSRHRGERRVGPPAAWAPTRRLPERDTRRFRAAREGQRPEECAGGHCGVDLGGKKGELVMAAHDGVIERVQRDAEEGGRRGNEGRFILINHKGATVVTSYIHLDGIREDLRPGIPVKAGEAIGTVGDTGVKESGPHLHFAVSVRPRPDGDMLYIDPEPMLHLWPLKNQPVASLHPDGAGSRAAHVAPHRQRREHRSRDVAAPSLGGLFA